MQLDNNIITEIAGLESLTKLKWLDLSFNMIEQIKGLENLRELEDLSLFSNRITVLEGLDTLEKLNVLSVGSNAIQNLEDSVKYLFKLRNNLEVLKIKENSFKETGEKDYKGRIIAFLRGLKYLDYELIEQKERDKAEADYRAELENTNLDVEDNAGNQEQKDLLQSLTEAHIHHTQNLFLNCCEAFENYDVIAGDHGFRKFNDVFQYTDPNIEEFLTQFQQNIKTKQKEKTKKIHFCESKMRDAERLAERQSIQKIEMYQKAEKHIFRDIFKKRSQHAADGDEHFEYYSGQENKLVSLIYTLKGDLMDIEMALQQTLDSAKGQFFSEIKKINEEMATLQAEVFSNISSEFVAFGIKLKEELNKEKENFIQRIESEDMNSVIEDYGISNSNETIGTALEVILDENKDAVDEMVTLFIEKIEGEANNKDGLITRGRVGEWQALENKIKEDQNTRSRQIICEIIETTKGFQTSIQDKFETFRNEDMEGN